MPNEATIAAMKEDSPTFDNVDALMDELHAGELDAEQPTLTVLRELEQELLAMTSVRDVPRAPFQKVSISPWHGALLSTDISPKKYYL